MTTQTKLSPEVIANTVKFLEGEDVTRNFYSDEELLAQRVEDIVGVDAPPAHDDYASVFYGQVLRTIEENPVDAIVPTQPRYPHLGGHMLSALELGVIAEADRNQQYPSQEGVQ